MLIDLRSDTVTRPTEEMRAAMATAEVGDDVYSEDPTINALEKRAAEIFGREAALFVPSGTMGNQIAIRLHTKPGQEVIAESRAHILDWEMATTAVFSGCLVRAVYADRGLLTWREIEPVIYAKGAFRAPTGLIELENTANLAGGTVTPLPVLEEIWANAKERNLPVHMDGARIFNAATTLGLSVQQLTSGCDTVMFCLSKGLCAPVGSMLLGSSALMAEARLLRKSLGGGMRQAGILAAAGLIALEKMPWRLHEDHANAKLLAEKLAVNEHVQLDPATVESNIVIFGLISRVSAAKVVQLAKTEGVLCSALVGNSIRLVTHNDVNTEQCATVIDVLLKAIDTAAEN